MTFTAANPPRARFPRCSPRCREPADYFSTSGQLRPIGPFAADLQRQPRHSVVRAEPAVGARTPFHAPLAWPNLSLSDAWPRQQQPADDALCADGRPNAANTLGHGRPPTAGKQPPSIERELGRPFEIAEVPIAICRGDDMRFRPIVIKIDVEGLELDVLQGLEADAGRERAATDDRAQPRLGRPWPRGSKPAATNSGSTIQRRTGCCAQKPPRLQPITLPAPRAGFFVFRRYRASSPPANQGFSDSMPQPHADRLRR